MNISENNNIVFFWPNTSYYNFSMSDILENKKIIYINEFQPNNNILRFVQACHFSTKVNRFFRIPFKSIWFNSFLSKIKQNDQNDYTFIIHSQIFFRYARYSNFIKYLRKKYNCKIVLMFMDTVSSYSKYMNEYELNSILSDVDLVFTYSKYDAQRHGINYYPSFYSNISAKININNDSKYFSDILFIGRNKNRINQLHKFYNIFTKAGFECKFIITDVSEEEMLHNSDIVYNQYVEYDEVLKYIKNCKSILEITQENSDGFTFRDFEALIFDKKLITDNMSFLTSKYGKNPNVFYFIDKDSEDIINFIRQDSAVSYNYKNEFSPMFFVRHIMNCTTK